MIFPKIVTERHYEVVERQFQVVERQTQVTERRCGPFRLNFDHCIDNRDIMFSYSISCENCVKERALYRPIVACVS